MLALRENRATLKTYPGAEAGFSGCMSKKGALPTRIGDRLVIIEVPDVCPCGRKVEGSGLDRVLDELRRLRRVARTPDRVEAVLAPAGSGDSGTTTGVAPEAPAQIRAAATARSLATGTFVAGAGPHQPDSASDARSVETSVLPPPIISERAAGPDSPFPFLPVSTELSAHSEPNRAYFDAIAKIGLQVAKALDYANRQGVLHRDIKPSNLLLDTQGNISVADFGLAKMTEIDDITRSGQLVGTTRYMAPGSRTIRAASG